MARTGLVKSIALAALSLCLITQTVSESFLLRAITYLPAGNAFSPTVKLKGIFMMVCRSDCPSADENVKSKSRPDKATARRMCFIMLTFLPITNAGKIGEVGHG